MNNYEYRSLDPEAHEIRLLQIQKSSDESALITVTLEHASLDDRPPFNALSYTWGDETPTTQIAIRDGVSQGFVPVRRNLFEFLKEARQSTKVWSSEWIWIDQISINQRDQDERGHQVGQMRKVYSMTQATLVWPWSWSEHSLEAARTSLAKRQVDSNQLICESPQFEGRESGNETNDSGKPLTKLLTYGLYTKILETPYWERLWIIQEVVLAPKYCIVLSGQLWTSSDLMEATLSLSKHFDPDYKQSVIYKRLKYFENYRRRISQYNPTSSWDQMIYLSKDATCTNPLDRVYGVMGLLHESLHVPSDYGISEIELFRRILYKQMSTPRSCGRWGHVYNLLQVWRFSDPRQTVGTQWDLTLVAPLRYVNERVAGVETRFGRDKLHRHTRREIRRVVRLALDELDMCTSPPFTRTDAHIKFDHYTSIRFGYITTNLIHGSPWLEMFLHRHGVWTYIAYLARERRRSGPSI